MPGQQIEERYTKIPNDIMKALAMIRVPGEARQVFDVIIRKILGFHKTEDMISLSQFTIATGLKKTTVSRAINKLLKMNMIIKKDNNNINIYMINKDLGKWEPLSKKIITYKKESVLLKQCYICGFSDAIEEHHIKPLAKGGSGKVDNIIILCLNCHSLVHKGKYNYDFLFTQKDNVEKSVIQKEYPEKSVIQKEYPETSVIQKEYPETSVIQKEYPETSVIQKEYPGKSVIQLDNTFSQKVKKVLSKKSTTKESITKETFKEKKYSQNCDEIRLSKLLFDLIQERDPDHNKPNLQKWALHIDRLIRLSKRNIDDIEAVIRFCQIDEFWQNNILSTSKLRDQFGQLYLKMKKTMNNNEGESLEERMHKREIKHTKLGIKIK